MLPIFPTPGGMSLTKLSLAGNISIIPGQGEFGQWHPAWGLENQHPSFLILFWYYGYPHTTLNDVWLFLMKMRTINSRFRTSLWKIFCYKSSDAISLPASLDIFFLVAVMIGVKYLFIWWPEVLKRKSLKNITKNIFFNMKNMAIPPVSRSGN